ncbi:MAG TPA: MFS transporter [Acidimicrobiales bacterium]|nr:MFS transporter [Acidimicrobiales bacterium]
MAAQGPGAGCRCADRSGVVEPLPASTPEPGLPDTRARLPRPFWRLWASAMSSDLGDGLVLVALPLLALTLTHDPLPVAGVAVADQLPAFLLAPLIGVLIDRVDRRVVIVTVQVLQCAVAGGLAVMVAHGRVTLPMLYGAAALLGASATAFSVCKSVLVPALVPDVDLERANGRLFVAEASARDLAGQGIGGMAFAAGRAVPFAADALSFLASGALLLTCLPPRSVVVAGQPSWRTDLVDGFRWFAGHRELQRLAAMVCTFAGCQSAAFATLALFLTTQVHAGRVLFGVLLMVGSLGSLCGTVLAPRLAHRYGSWAATAIGGTAAGYAYVLLAAHTSPVVAGLGLAVEGWAVVVGNVASSSLRQRLIPDDLRGRVGTVFRMGLLGSGVVGAALGGLLAGALGMRSEMAAVAAAQLAMVAVLCRPRRPALRVVAAPRPVLSGAA